MPELRVHNFAISLDGYGAGSDQGLDNPSVSAASVCTSGCSDRDEESAGSRTSCARSHDSLTRFPTRFAPRTTTGPAAQTCPSVRLTRIGVSG
jgi:hypothetical protein